MRRRTLLEIILGGVFGAVLGGIITVLLLFFWTNHWLAFSLTILGAMAGIWRGDQALYGLMRMVSWLPG